MEKASNNKGPGYETRVHRLSEASVRKINVPYSGTNKVMGIDWESDEYAVDQQDPRWEIPDGFDIGAHDWYKGLSHEDKVRVGLYRYTQIVRVGSEFENALNIGVNYANMTDPSNSEVARYAMHEAEEEHRHVLMFRQFVAQTGIEPEGSPEWFRSSAWLIAPVARKARAAFWWLVLSGEEPIDKLQRELIQMNKMEPGSAHPLMDRVMRVHVEEEARHMNFADASLEVMVGKLKAVRNEDGSLDRSPRALMTTTKNVVQKEALAVAAPIASLIAAKVIVKPSRKSLKDMGIPRSVADEVWANKTMAPLLEDARDRADRLGLRDGRRKSVLGKLTWRLLDIDEDK